MSSGSTEKEGPSPWTDESKRKFNNKAVTEFYDPCQEAANKSYKCIHRNAGDKSMCADYFQAYRDCKKAWQEKRKEENRARGSFL